MQTQRFKLPPLATLTAFEAAARHLSFKVAADELQVTPSAVSQHVKALESTINTPLFTRQNRGVQLTAEGRQLKASIESGFIQISKSLEVIGNKGQRIPVTLCNTTAMSSLWLTPRLTRFWKDHGTIPVDQHVTDSIPDYYDQFDLLISYGKPPVADSNIKFLFDDRLVPVCSPRLATTLKGKSLRELADQSLIYLDTAHGWTTWNTWFTSLGYTGALREGTHVNNYSIAVQCAQDNVGILLGWERMLAPLINNKLLVTLDEHSLAAPESFYLSYTGKDTPGESVSILMQWLLKSV